MKFKLLLLLLLSLACTTLTCEGQHAVNRLKGIWKVEGKEKFEEWRQEGMNLLGESFTINNGERHVLETLRIKIEDGKIIFEATVPDQNEGVTIPFILNDKKAVLSFENLEHDFPTQIIYEFINDNRLFIKVQGIDGKGFSFFMDKQ